jgi:hypothetical protein
LSRGSIPPCPFKLTPGLVSLSLSAAPQIPPPMQHKAPAPPPPSGPKYVAIYDYAAADEDEVSFVEGDIMIDVTVIDDGWMEARVQRTGQYGMLPSNYVEKK